MFHFCSKIKFAIFAKTIQFQYKYIPQPKDVIHRDYFLHCWKLVGDHRAMAAHTVLENKPNYVLVLLVRCLRVSLRSPSEDHSRPKIQFEIEYLSKIIHYRVLLPNSTIKIFLNLPSPSPNNKSGSNFERKPNQNTCFGPFVHFVPNVIHKNR